MLPWLPFTSWLLFGLAVTSPAQTETRLVTGSIRIQRIVIRVPMMSMTAARLEQSPSLPPINWVERKANRCVSLDKITAVATTQTDSVDLLLTEGKRLRARFGADCPALNFYSGIYLRPSGDGKICADRDWLRARSGAQCQIQAFRSLVPAR